MRGWKVFNFSLHPNVGFSFGQGCHVVVLVVYIVFDILLFFRFLDGFTNVLRLIVHKINNLATVKVINMRVWKTTGRGM